MLDRILVNSGNIPVPKYIKTILRNFSGNLEEILRNTGEKYGKILGKGCENFWAENIQKTKKFFLNRGNLEKFLQQLL